jgi:hypothetical protein
MTGWENAKMVPGYGPEDEQADARADYRDRGEYAAKLAEDEARWERQDYFIHHRDPLGRPRTESGKHPHTSELNDYDRYQRETLREARARVGFTRGPTHFNPPQTYWEWKAANDAGQKAYEDMKAEEEEKRWAVQVYLNGNDRIEGVEEARITPRLDPGISRMEMRDGQMEEVKYYMGDQFWTPHGYVSPEKIRRMKPEDRHAYWMNGHWEGVNEVPIDGDLRITLQTTMNREAEQRGGKRKPVYPHYGKEWGGRSLDDVERDHADWLAKHPRPRW